MGRKTLDIGFDFSFGYGFYQVLPKLGYDLKDIRAVFADDAEGKTLTDDELEALGRKRLDAFAIILLTAHRFLCEQEATEPIITNRSQAMKVLEQIPLEAISDKFVESNVTTIDPVEVPDDGQKKTV